MRWENATLIGALLVAALAGLAIILTGCGASERATAHSALNVVTDVADPSYELAVDTCHELEMAIVRRESTRAEDDADIARVRETCDAVFAGFEAVRIAQREARALVDAEGSGTVVAEAIEALGRLWRDLQALVPQLAELGGGA